MMLWRPTHSSLPHHLHAVFHITVTAPDGSSYVLDDNMTLHDVQNRFVIGRAWTVAALDAAAASKERSDAMLEDAGHQMQLFYRLAPEAMVPYRLALDKWRAKGSPLATTTADR